MVITLGPEQRYRVLVLRYRLHGIPINAIGHPQKVESFDHALGIL